MMLQQKTLEKLRIIINEDSERRSGPMLVSFFNKLGFNDVYQQGFPSRGAYTDEKLRQINGTPELDKCIKQVFAVINFIGDINKLDNLIKGFNQYLVFDKWAVRRNNEEIRFEKLDKIIIDSNNNEEKTELKEADFLKKEFKDLNIDSLGLETAVSDIIKLRLREIEICLKNDAPLSSIFLIGSTLEGILLGIALSNTKVYNKAISAPKESVGGPAKQFHLWSLNNFIDVSFEVGFLKEDVKKFSHALRDFRNYIHPYEQMSSKFNPNKHTANICWQVLRAAIYQLSSVNTETQKQ